VRVNRTPGSVPGSPGNWCSYGDAAKIELSSNKSHEYMDTDAFLQHYFNVLEIYGEVNKGQWTSIITSIRTNQSILQSKYDILENVLKDELSLLKDTDILAMYKETEEGSSLEDNKESYSIDFIQMALVEELMDRITFIAWEQANQLP